MEDSSNLNLKGQNLDC